MLQGGMDLGIHGVVRQPSLVHCGMCVGEVSEKEQCGLLALLYPYFPKNSLM